MAREGLSARQAAVRRYSRLVRLAKIALPVAALGVVALIFVVGRERGDVGDLFTAEELARLGAGLRLDNPRFAGVTEGGEPFVLTARSAEPDGPMADVIVLDAPEGEVALPDGRTIRGQARAGTMRREAETLTLEGGVALETSDGYRFTSDEVTIDLAAKRATAPGAVEGTGPNGRIEAGSFRTAGGNGELRGARIFFEDGVRVLFTPPPRD